MTHLTGFFLYIQIWFLVDPIKIKSHKDLTFFDFYNQLMLNQLLINGIVQNFFPTSSPKASFKPHKKILVLEFSPPLTDLVGGGSRNSSQSFDLFTCKLSLKVAIYLFFGKCNFSISFCLWLLKATGDYRVFPSAIKTCLSQQNGSEGKVCVVVDDVDWRQKKSEVKEKSGAQKIFAVVFVLNLKSSNQTWMRVGKGE